MERDVSDGVPPWLLWASWAFWLAVTGVVAALALNAVATHRADAAAGARNWHLRVNICKRLSKTPRPPWWECHVRADRDGANLLAPRSADDQLPD